MLRRLLLLLGPLLGLPFGLLFGLLFGLQSALFGLLGLTLGSPAHAAAQPRIELSVSPAWKGWSRPGRTTELDIRLGADAATRVRLEVASGRTTLHAEVDLQPGRVVRLQMPVGSVERVEVSALAAGGLPVRRAVGLSLSESPVLGLGLASSEPVGLEGFHAVALAAEDLPRNASAYASVDALMVDAPTLRALDQSQLVALLAHAAACGRIVVVDVEPPVRRLLEGAGGCGGRALMSAATLAQAKDMLAVSLGTSVPPAMTLAGLGDLARSGDSSWNRVALALAFYFAVAVLVLVFMASLPTLLPTLLPMMLPMMLPIILLTPVLASLAVLALLHLAQPASQLIVWSEGGSGAQQARYQAWQRFAGSGRERARVAIPAQLAPSVQPCDRAQTLHFEFDAGRGQVTFAEFDTRLFRQVRLCFSGAFPLDRAPVASVSHDGAREIRNAGSKAWPQGVLLADGQVHRLPALGADAHTLIGADAHTGTVAGAHTLIGADAHTGAGAGARTDVEATQALPQRDAAVRAALSRTAPGEVAALWELELGGVAGVPIASKAWLLVAVPTP